MNICYAYRKSTWYPHQGTRNDLPPKEIRASYLKKVKEIGFGGFEFPRALPDGQEINEQNAKAFRQELEDAGLSCLAIRGGGGMSHPRVAATNKARLESCVRFAAWMGAPVVNSTTGGIPPRDPQGPGSSNTGEPTSQGSSREASPGAYHHTAQGFAQVADIAADLGVALSIEVHQHSISDNSWSILHLLDLIDRPNVGVNPDLGNIYWTYENPEETCEDAINALASRTNYWHCKNLVRVHYPQLHQALFLQVPLTEGDIDYRYAVSAMKKAGYDGSIAVEGRRLGDQILGDEKSASYMKALWDEA
jgi:sugar phosphate isomerase/epimerase